MPQFFLKHSSHLFQRQRNDNLLDKRSENDKRKTPILSEEHFFKVGSYLREISKAEVWTHVLRARFNVRTLRVCLHQKSRDTPRGIWGQKGELNLITQIY